MVYIHSWQEFQDAAELLYAKSSNKVRYSIKWKSASSEGRLVLKITDDTTCIKFKTNSSIFLNRFESLNLSLLQKMQNWKQPEGTPVVPSAAAPAPAPTADLHPPIESELASSILPQTSSAIPIPTQTPASGGVKKKKPKKKK